LNDLGWDEHQSALRQQTILARFGELALRSEDLDEILTEACRLVGEALGTDLAKVMELLEDGQTLWARAGVGWKPGVVGEATVKAEDDTSEGHAIKTGEPMISPDIGTETRFRYPSFLTDNGVKAVANVLILGGKDRPPFGLLQIDSREPREFNDDDTAFLQSYANLIAAAVDRLRVIGDMRDAEARLRASLDRQQAALATGLLGFFEWDVPAGMITADQHFAGFYGLDPEAVGSGVPLAELMTLIHPDDRTAALADIEPALASLADYDKEVRLVRPDGTVRWMHVRGRCYEQEGGRPLRYTGTATDVTASKAAEASLRQANEALEARVAKRTRELVEANVKLRAEAEERERVEEALRQSHKMEAVGQLTGGIAHDFNNLLTGISGSLELVRTRAAQGRTAELGRYLDAALASAGRAAALTHRLLAFSRRQTLDPKPTDVNRLVRGMEDLIRRTVGPGIQVETRLAGGLWPALCDANQLESALLNLVINARDAMPDGGRIVIEAVNAALPGPRWTPGTPSFGGVPPGEYMVLSIADTGAGMTPEVLERAFDPFFTTKPLGQGTGLGLSMIYGFMQQSGGHLRLRSAPGQGTTATIYLPRHLGAADHPAEADVAASPSSAEAGAVVLAVEDEPAVRMVIADALSDLGYTVLEADNARSGLGIVESGTRIDLLLTDVGLPGGMNGRQLADAARSRRPGLKVLLVTGYAEAAATGHGLLDQGMEVMTKPFAVDALTARVQGMIGG
jgi:PAS domain S-box-containing protein